MDRHGPEGVIRMKAAMYAAVVFGLSIPMWATVAEKLFGLAGWAHAVVTLVGAFTLAAASIYVSLALGNAAGGVATVVTAGGTTTPYEEQFSQEQALVMKRDYAAALALYEQRIAQTIGEPRVRIAAADLYVTNGQNPQRAAELYREVQRIPNVMSGHDVYASNKLADLYLGPLADPGRALVEFRRLIERYPETKIASHARSALANIKAQLSADPAEPSSSPPW